MKFDTLAQIQAHQFGGNHHCDSSAFSAIEVFVGDTTHSLADRAEALRIMGRDGMGLSPEENGEDMSDADLVEEFIQHCCTCGAAATCDFSRCTCD